MSGGLNLRCGNLDTLILQTRQAGQGASADRLQLQRRDQTVDGLTIGSDFATVPRILPLLQDLSNPTAGAGWRRVEASFARSARSCQSRPGPGAGASPRDHEQRAARHRGFLRRRVPLPHDRVHPGGRLAGAADAHAARRNVCQALTASLRTGICPPLRNNPLSAGTGDETYAVLDGAQDVTLPAWNARITVSSREST